MSDHAPSHPGDFGTHSHENHAELAARYPDQFSGEHMGLDWADGWHEIIAKVRAYAHEHPVRWYQIKKMRQPAHALQGGPLRMDIEQSGQTSRKENSAHVAPGAVTNCSLGEFPDCDQAVLLRRIIRTTPLVSTGGADERRHAGGA